MILDSSLDFNRSIENHNINLQVFNYGVNQWSGYRWGTETVVFQQNPSFSYDLDQTIPAFDGLNYQKPEYDTNDGGDAEPVLIQNPSSYYSYLHQAHVACFGSGITTPPPNGWGIEELKKFLEIDTDEENEDGRDTDETLLNRNPSLPDLHQTGSSCFESGITSLPLDGFNCWEIEELAKILETDGNEWGEHRVEESDRQDADEPLRLHQNPSFSAETSSLKCEIPILPLDGSNYCDGVEDLMKTPFDEIDGMNQITIGDEVMSTDFGSLTDLNINLSPIEEISQVDWDELMMSDIDVATNDGSGGNDNGSLPFPSNVIGFPEAALIEFGTQDGWLNDFIDGRIEM